MRLSFLGSAKLLDCPLNGCSLGGESSEFKVFLSARHASFHQHFRRTMTLIREHTCNLGQVPSFLSL